MGELDISGQRLRYTRHGAGEPVLTISNVAERPEDWPLPFVAAINEAGYEVITFEHDGPRPASIRELAGDAAGLLDHLGVDRTRLWGFSQGALIAQELASARPDLVRAVVLTSTCGRPFEHLRLYLDAFQDIKGREAELPHLFALLCLLGYPPDELIDDDFVASFTAMVPEWLRHAGVDSDADAGARSRFASLSHEDRLTMLARVTVPCMVMGLEHDRIFPAKLGEEVANTIPGALYVEIKGAGHDWSRHADQVMQHVIDFFGSN